MASSTSTANDLFFTIEQEIRVNASIEATFDAMLEELGPHNETHEGKPMPMKLEAKPGGRWYRELGNDNGHLWGHVQAIKRPTLLEFAGPLFLSCAVANNVQYRLTAVDGGTLITFRHQAMGMLPDDAKTGMPQGWKHMLENVRKAAENAKKK